VKEIIDRVVVITALIFDLNFKDSFKIIKDNEYVEKIFNRFNFKKEETKEQMKLIRKRANDYINNKIKKN